MTHSLAWAAPHTSLPACAVMACLALLHFHRTTLGFCGPAVNEKSAAWHERQLIHWNAAEGRLSYAVEARPRPSGEARLRIPRCKCSEKWMLRCPVSPRKDMPGCRLDWRSRFLASAVPHEVLFDPICRIFNRRNCRIEPALTVAPGRPSPAALVDTVRLLETRSVNRERGDGQRPGA